MRWQDKITKKELKHVREWSGNTLGALKNTIENQKKIKDKDGGVPCYVCLDVGRKLGLIK